MNRERLESILSKFPELTIGLVGDLFLDRYLELEPGIEEFSIETGLEAYQVRSVRNSPGALGTVMNNLAAIGVGRLVPVTVIGDDGHGYDLLRALKPLPVNSSGIIQSKDRLTPTYTKPLRQDASGNWKELNRLDVRTREPLSEAVTDELCQKVREAFDRCDGLVVLDQVCEDDCGVVNSSVRRVLEQLAVASSDKLVLVDSRAHVHRFKHGILKGNQSEFIAAARFASGENVDPDAAVLYFARTTAKPVFCSAGEEGIYIGKPSGEVEFAKGFPVLGPVDIVGAGDSASSGIMASLLSGASEFEAATIGNLAASITVQQLGTTGTATPEEIIAHWQSAVSDSQR